MAGLFGAVLSRSARLEALQRAALRDKLTGLLNRNAEPLLAERLYRPTEASPSASVLVCDIDRFKSVNDTHGHDAGDAVIAGVGRLISGRIRSTDLALRWGGEEFVIGLSGVAQDAALAVAEDIRDRLARTQIDIGAGRTLNVTCSIGLASLRAGEDVAQALRRADAALYQAKRGGRDRVAPAT
jgi:diguanylate cyclase (GGDEF)-like protein